MLSRVLGVIVCLQICAGGRPDVWHRYQLREEYSPHRDDILHQRAMLSASSQRKFQPETGPDLKDLVKECLEKELTNGPEVFQLPGVCAQFTCTNEMSGGGKTAKVDAQYCMKYFVPPPCYNTEEDTSLMFPQCCPHVVCPSE